MFDSDDSVMEFALSSSESSSSEDEVFEPSNIDRCGGSRVGRARNKNSDFEENVNRLKKQYFEPNCTYNDFVRRFRMNKCMFSSVYEKVKDLHYFKHKPACESHSGFASSWICQRPTMKRMSRSGLVNRHFPIPSDILKWLRENEYPVHVGLNDLTLENCSIEIIPERSLYRSC